MNEEFDAIDELGKAAHMPPKSTRDVLIVEPERIAALEAEVALLREALQAIGKGADLFPDAGCAYCGIGLEHRSWCPVTTARAALEPAP